jgi:glucose/arabinose dehydrogenase/mono/diheme cytochrome c family protein
MPKLLLALLPIAALAASLICHQHPAATATQPAGKPYGLDKRLPLTTSRVVGSPDPLPPYRIRKAYPNLALNYPIAVSHQPGSDRLLVITEEWSYGPTKLERFVDDPNVSKAETLLAINGVAYDIVFHPDYAKNGYLYISSNGPEKGPGPKKTMVHRYTMDRTPPYRLDPASAKLIIEWVSDGHNGGGMAFGHDGMFYVTSGDGTSDSDTNIVGQDMTSLLAKVLRIDVDHPDPGKSYAVPKDNPFVNMKDARPEIWAYGLRNPWRMTVDRKTGHLWVGQNGQDLWEQAYLVKKGENYGWSVMEGSHPFYPKRKPGPTPFVNPTIEHHHSEFRSLTGGIVYYGTKHPELEGGYLYGDYSTGKVWAMRHDGTKPLWHKELADTRLQVTGFGTDSRGEILICDHRGKQKGGLYTLEPMPKDAKPADFPRTLSATGLFASVKGHVVQPALIPYSVIAPLWGDNAYKERWIALPGADSKIEFTSSRGWEFPNGAVLVKSFALEMQEGNPATRKWVETRLLTRQEGEWFGYSYAWNDEQTEAFLVEGKGSDRPYTIKTAGGDRKQVWHYPSRTECMVCHSRAANWVLGLQALQMNKDHAYGGVVDNQLRTLDHIGVLQVNWANEVRNTLRDEAKAMGLKDKAIDEFVKKNTPPGDPVEQYIQVFSVEKKRQLVDPYDAKQDLELRALSYLHSNCAQCHVEAGGGNAMIDLEFTTKLDKRKLIDVAPQHDTFKLPGAKLIAPGQPESSVLLHRMGCRGRGQMPPLATSLVDETALQMLREWVRKMKK